MSDFAFTEEGFADYVYWQTQDKKTLRRINALLNDIQRNGYSTGIGKPEPLKNEKSGLWSRRIDEENRLVYRMDGGQIKIYQCRGHYDDK